MAHKKLVGPMIDPAEMSTPMVFHVWFSTKQRKWLLQGDILDAAREEIASAASHHAITLLEFEAIVDHVHILLESTPAGLTKAMNYLKGASARRLFQLFPEIRQDAHTRSFWQTGYGYKVVVPEAMETTRTYIKTQWDRLEDYERPPRWGPLARS
jgi:putative transposase